MADHECWIAAELTEGADPEVVVETIVDQGSKIRAGQVQGRVAAFHGGHLSLNEVKPAIKSVSDHLKRIVFVAAIEGGKTQSEYYDRADDLLKPTDELETSLGRRFASMHFDYYATRYGIDGAV